MDELVDARRVGEDGRFDLDGAVGSKQVGKWRGGAGVVVFRGAKRNRHDWRGSLGRRCLRILRPLLPEGRRNGSPNERYGQNGGQQRSRIQRLHSAPYPQDSSPKGLSVFVLNCLNRSQKVICFRQLTVLEYRHQ